MGNLAPRRQFAQNQPVIIIGCEVSKEHVPEELKKFGPGAYVIKSDVMYKSRPNAPDIGVTRVKFPTGKDELFLTNDLYPPGSVPSSVEAPRQEARPYGSNNTGSRIVNARR
jgi:hypothetical protein